MHGLKANAIMRTYTLHHLYPVMEYRWLRAYDVIVLSFLL
nr:MAG TPA: hypothetical protein [Caudoviricetes sp.]